MWWLKKPFPSKVSLVRHQKEKWVINNQMGCGSRKKKLIVKLGSCSSLLKSLNSTLKVSIQKQEEQSWRYNHSSPTTHPPPTHNFLKLVEGWFFTLFQLTNNTKDIFYVPFQIFKILKLLTTGDSVKTPSLRAWL